MLHSIDRGGRTGSPGEWATGPLDGEGCRIVRVERGIRTPGVCGATAVCAAAIAAQLSRQALVDLCLQSLCVALPLACCIPGDAIILQDTFAAGEAMSAIADRQRIRSLIIRQSLADVTGYVTAIFAAGLRSPRLLLRTPQSPIRCKLIILGQRSRRLRQSAAQAFQARLLILECRWRA